MKIGQISLKNNLILAPMAGVSDVAFRSLAINCGADFAVTEMVSAKALLYNNEKTFSLLEIAPNEKIKVVQIFGNNPTIMAEACNHPALQKFDIIDINMGCPTPKIVNNGDGCALMKNIELAREIISQCAKATKKPITVKFRSGWNKDNINCIEFARMCEDAGAKAITIHARTREQFYSGKADRELIKKVKMAVSIPVIASGDVDSAESYLDMKNTTGCDGVMIGRGALGSPYVFSKILGREYENSPLYYIKEHIRILKEYYPDKFILAHMRKHILWYLKGISGVKELKSKVLGINTLEETILELENFFKNKI